MREVIVQPWRWPGSFSPSGYSIHLTMADRDYTVKRMADFFNGDDQYPVPAGPAYVGLVDDGEAIALEDEKKEGLSPENSAAAIPGPVPPGRARWVYPRPELAVASIEKL